MVKEHNYRRVIVTGIVGLLVGLSSFGVFLYRWTFATWANLQLDELIYELSASLEGTSPEIIRGGMVEVILPTFGVLLLYVILIWVFSKKKRWWRRVFLWLCTVSSVVSLGFAIVNASQRLKLGAYIHGSQTESTFIEDHYVSADDVQLTFPEKKRNLIYIFLESMETSWMDKESGGLFETNVIPELTDLAKDSESFSGDSGLINGAYALSGTTWTMGAMFAHTAGLPLKISIEKNAMNMQREFFPGIISIGDILKKEGYNQALLIGSDAEFGGRKLYYEKHGEYRMLDYAYAAQMEQIPPNHRVWWGYEDFRLFENAKQALLDMSAQDEPFNLTMLTVDTHKEDGYVCAYCPDIYADRYSNVYACSSRLVYDFVEWIKQQEFYENTTLIVVGDHLTMDNDYGSDLEMKDRKVYTAFVNSAAQYEGTEKRIYSTYDMFPTTLAALGVEIEGERVGLGVNLYSGEPTLVEQYGVEYIDVETRKKSAFMEQIGQIEKKLKKDATVEITTENKEDEISVRVVDVVGIEEKIEKVEAEIWNEQGNMQKLRLKLQKDGSYLAKADISSYERAYGHLDIWVTDEIGNRQRVKQLEGNLKLVSCGKIETYLDELKKLKNCSILLTIQDDGTYGLSQEAKDKLKELGLKIDFSDKFRYSYYAAITPDEIIEKCEAAELKYEGELPDGTLYHLNSCGLVTGTSECGIIINGIDYAHHLRGMNFAVYDHELGKVVSSVVYDTCLNTPNSRMNIEKTSNNELQIQIHDISVNDLAKEVYVRYWNKYWPQKVYTQEIVDFEIEGVYKHVLQLPPFMSGNGYLAAYAIDTQGRIFRIAETEL